ncbi:MAG: EAL and HDOD domain-containing protein [Planctomycetota bacterium]|jgi:EAL and modified HD-GYP domain-containing signal transduction protein
MQSFIARQPILDTCGNVYAYELLFRSGPENYFSSVDGVDGDQATTRTMGDSVSIHGLEQLTNGKKAFINVTRRILVEELYTILPAAQTVLEILETVEPDQQIIEAARRARAAGYQVALDDFTFDQRFEPLLQEIDILKVDFQDSTGGQRRAFAERGRALGLHMLAEKVECHDDVAEATELGYHYLQGYFFCKPQLISRTNIVGNKVRTVEFLAEVNQRDLDLDRIGELIRSDVGMSYKLLKYLNSVSMGLRSRIESIHHGLVLLGTQQIRKWGSIIALSALGDDKPSELFSTCLVRARFCESMAPLVRLDERQLDLFAMGMLSVIDALVDQPLAEVIDGVPVSDDVRTALLGGSSCLRPVYDLALAMERGAWEDMASSAGELGVGEIEVLDAYRAAIVWANGMLGDASGDDAKVA